MTDIRTESSRLGPERPQGGRMDGWTDVQTDAKKCTGATYRTSALWGRCPKGDRWNNWPTVGPIDRPTRRSVESHRTRLKIDRDSWRTNNHSPYRVGPHIAWFFVRVFAFPREKRRLETKDCGKREPQLSIRRCVALVYQFSLSFACAYLWYKLQWLQNLTRFSENGYD